MMRWLQQIWRRPMSANKVRRLAALAANPFAQPDVRSRQMQRLLEEGSAAALAGVLQRFGVLAQGHIADEEEKTWLVDALVEKADSALPPLRDYIRRHSKLTHALRAFERIAGDENAAEFFAEVLRAYGPDDHRSAEAKVQLISALGERAGAQRLAAWVAPSVADHSDDVVGAALAVLGRCLPAGQLSAEDAAALMPPLLARLGDPHTPPRVARLVMSLLAERRWPLPSTHRQLPSHCAKDFVIDDRGQVSSAAAGG